MAIILKVPEESPGYRENSDFVIIKISAIIQDAIDTNNNRIFIHSATTWLD